MFVEEHDRFKLYVGCRVGSDEGYDHGGLGFAG